MMPLFALLFLGTLVFGPPSEALLRIHPQSQVILTPVTHEGQIRTIRQQYNSINKQLRTYRKVKKELSGFSVEGGELTAYLSRQEIVKIVANHYGEGGQTMEDYYFKDGKLIFVFERITHYDAPLSGKVVSASENRYYFHNDQLIRWIDENTRMATDVDGIESKRKEYLANSKIFTEGVRSRARTIEASAAFH